LAHDQAMRDARRQRVAKKVARVRAQQRASWTGMDEQFIIELKVPCHVSLHLKGSKHL
jgi:hypothetical protein